MLARSALILLAGLAGLAAVDARPTRGNNTITDRPNHSTNTTITNRPMHSSNTTIVHDIPTHSSFAAAGGLGCFGNLANATAPSPITTVCTPVAGAPAGTVSCEVKKNADVTSTPVNNLIHHAAGLMPGKTIMCPNGLGGSGNCGGTDWLPTQSFKLQDLAERDACNVGTPECGPTHKNTEARTVRAVYDDHSTMDFCVCPTPVMPIETAAAFVGQMPSVLRVGAVKSIKIQAVDNQNPPGAAAAYGDRIVIFSPGMPLNVFIHESAHTWDWANSGGHYMSNGAEYAAALAADTCITDAYSGANPVENFAQMVVTYIGETRNAQTWANRIGADCMKNARQFVATYFPIKPPGVIVNAADVIVARSDIAAQPQYGLVPAGGCIISQTRVYKACMQTDGNFVIYNVAGGKMTALWSTWMHNGLGGGVQGVLNPNDGRFSVIDATGVSTWSSPAGAKVNNRFYMRMQDDGNLLVKDFDENVLWSSGTWHM
ncbi:hypothetical protein BDZ88DRAFT_55243 [Geranomyces variabilis]|nr:hypothetical protein BDZ88DRAFT_55243 [Geranomyces variabilis]KAJ3140130.1 hypothetical protein HDU90_008354 [Geranomyces variabilis]